MHMPDMLGVIFYEQRSMATKWGKQESREAVASKFELIEALFTLTLRIREVGYGK